VNILFRTSGSKNIGLGHVRRCVTISNFMAEKFNTNCYFLIDDCPEIKPFISSISNECLFLIDHKANRESDLAKIDSIIRTCDINFVILDLLDLYLESSFVDGLHQLPVITAAIIDDSFYRLLDLDLVLNGNPNQLKFTYPEEYSSKYLLGPEFFIMDEAYTYLSDCYRDSGKCFVSLGGSDHHDLLFDLLAALEGVDQVKSIRLVSSTTSGYFDSLKEYLIDYQKPVELLWNVNSLSSYWFGCEFAVTAGGNTLFERIAAGIPGATLCQLDRQNEIADCFERMGLNYNLGLGHTLEYNDLTVKLTHFFLSYSNRTAQLATLAKTNYGSGLQRFVDRILEMRHLS